MVIIKNHCVKWFTGVCCYQTKLVAGGLMTVKKEYFFLHDPGIENFRTYLLLLLKMTCFLKLMP